MSKKLLIPISLLILVSLFTFGINAVTAAPPGWSVDSLSQPRSSLEATTIGNKAMFAGGETGINPVTYTDIVDIYDDSI